MSQIPDPKSLVQLENNLRILLLAMGVASVGLAGYMKKAFLSARDSEYLLSMIVPKSELMSLTMEHQSKLKEIGLMVHGDSLAWALSTAPAIFGMGFLFMFGNSWDLVIFVGISYLGLAINRPQDLSVSGRLIPS